MKKADSTQVRQELRQRYLEYIQNHVDGDRIPPMAEIRRALGVTNYMLMKCMNDLKREGVLFCTSRKTGVHLAPQRLRRKVVGLLIESGRPCEYISNAAWMEGFCHAFARRSDVYIRQVYTTKISNLPGLFKSLGLDALVILASEQTYRKLYAILPEEMRVRTIGCISQKWEPSAKWLENVIWRDRLRWIREYVSAAKRRGCRDFLLIFSGAEEDAQTPCRLLADEIRKQGLEWSSDRLIVGCNDLRKKIENLRQKYPLDAVCCSGVELQSRFFKILKDWQDYRPFMPQFGHNELFEEISNSPWLNTEIVSESEEDYELRLGMETGERAKTLAQNGRVFESYVFPKKYNRQETVNENTTEKLMKGEVISKVFNSAG